MKVFAQVFLVFGSLVLLEAPARAAEKGGEKSGPEERAGDGKAAPDMKEKSGVGEGRRVEEPGTGESQEAEKRSPEVRLEDVVVTASRYGMKAGDVPGSVVLISSRDLEAMHVNGTDEFLENTPGIYDRRTKGMMDIMPWLTVRGFDTKRCLVLVDGHRRKDWLIVPPGVIERIEVVKGPFSALYGDRALGGVLNLITKAPDKRILSVSAGGGEHGTWTGGVLAGDRLGPFHFLVAGRARETEGWVTSFYTVSEYTGATLPTAAVTGWEKTQDKYGNTRYLVGDKGQNRYKDYNVTAQMGLEIPDLLVVRSHFYAKDSEYGYEGSKSYLWDNGTLVNDGVVEIYDGSVSRKLRLSSSKFDSSYGSDPSYGAGLTATAQAGEKVEIEARIGWSFDDHWYADPSSTYSTTETYELWGGLKGVFDLKHMDLLGKHTVVAGIDFRDGDTDCEKWQLGDWMDIGSRTKLDYDMSGTVGTVGAYLQDEWAVHDAITAFLGFRWDRWATSEGESRLWNSGLGEYVADSYPSAAEDAFTFKLALIFKPWEKTAVRGSFGTAFRGPEATDLYKTWVYYSSVYPGNPDLKPERNLAWEISVTHEFGKLGDILLGTVISGAFFDNTMDDYIYRRALDAAGIASYNAAHGTSYSNVKPYDNVARARNYGLEASVEQRFPLGLSFFANWTHHQTIVLEHESNPDAEGKRLPYVPRNICSAGIKFRKTFEEKHAFSAGFAGRFVEKPFTTDTNTDFKQHVYGAYEDFVVFDLKISYTLDGRYRFSFWIDNVFDETYYQYYKAPGRSAGASLELRF